MTGLVCITYQIRNLMHALYLLPLHYYYHFCIIIFYCRDVLKYVSRISRSCKSREVQGVWRERRQHRGPGGSVRETPRRPPGTAHTQCTPALPYIT
jgi:hypothetical protein